MIDVKKWNSFPKYLDWHLKIWFKENGFKFGKIQRIKAHNLIQDVLLNTDPRLMLGTVEKAFLKLFEEKNGLEFTYEELKEKSEEYFTSVS